VVSREDNQCLIEKLIFVHVAEELSQREINIGHFSIIRLLFVLGTKWCRRHIRIVGVKTMDPKKPGSLSGSQPAKGSVYNDFSLSS